MAEPAITEDSIRAALIERLKATHVEIQDMSGMHPVLTISLTSSRGPEQPRDAIPSPFFNSISPLCMNQPIPHTP